MRLLTVLCILIAIVADVAAAVLLLPSQDAASLVVILGSVAAMAAAAGVIQIIKTRPPAEVAAEAPVPILKRSPVSPLDMPLVPAQTIEEAPGGELLDNRPWMKLVEEIIALFDELDRHRIDFDATRLEVADHVICRLQEMLERCDVEPISDEGDFDRNRHQPERSARVAPGATVTKTLSPGFRVGTRILRRARVSVQNPLSPLPPT
jgi:hypothetical protein